MEIYRKAIVKILEGSRRSLQRNRNMSANFDHLLLVMRCKARFSYGLCASSS